MNYSIFREKKGSWYLLAFFFVFVDMGYEADSEEVFRFTRPQILCFFPVFARFRRFFAPFCSLSAMGVRWSMPNPVQTISKIGTFGKHEVASRQMLPP